MGVKHPRPQRPDRLPDGSERTFPPSGTVARVVTFQTSAANLDGIPTAYRRTGNVEGLLQ